MRHLTRKDLSTLRPGDVFVWPEHVNALDHETIVPEERVTIMQIGKVEDFAGGRCKRSIIGRDEFGAIMRMDIYAGKGGHMRNNVRKASRLAAA